MGRNFSSAQELHFYLDSLPSDLYPFCPSKGLRSVLLEEPSGQHFMQRQIAACPKILIEDDIDLNRSFVLLMVLRDSQIGNGSTNHYGAVYILKNLSDLLQEELGG